MMVYWHKIRFDALFGWSIVVIKFNLAIAATAGAVVYNIAINSNAQPADNRAALTEGTVKKSHDNMW